MKVEKLGKIDLPPPNRGKKEFGPLTSALMSMEVGECIAVDFSQEKSGGQTFVAKKHTGNKYTTRKLADGRTGIWRVS